MGRNWQPILGNFLLQIAKLQLASTNYIQLRNAFISLWKFKRKKVVWNVFVFCLSRTRSYFKTKALNYFLTKFKICFHRSSFVDEFLRAIFFLRFLIRTPKMQEMYRISYWRAKCKSWNLLKKCNSPMHHNSKEGKISSFLVLLLRKIMK
jgi:hypothetical protein